MAAKRNRGAMRSDHLCRGLTHQRTFCARPAGWGTDHPGEGRCKFHAGRVPIKHGLDSIYSRTKLGPLIERVRADRGDADPHDLRSEVELVRAGLLHLIESARGGLIPAALLADLAEKASRIAERDHRIKTSKAITLETLVHVVQQAYIIVGQEIAGAQVALLKLVPAAHHQKAGSLFSDLLAAIERRSGELQIPGREANRKE
jgi:hypothetical protein